jgi:hypothetical protein
MAMPNNLEPVKSDQVRETEVVMVIYSEHKHVIRYKSKQPGSIVDNVYVSKKLAEKMPSEIIVTIKVPE